jgi:hypothetical protein
VKRRNYRAALAHDRCWDRRTQEIYERHGEPLDDCILQNREELIALCEFIEERRIRSYLEIGIWTGRLLCALQRLFSFDRVAACDDGYARRHGLPIALPAGAIYYEGDSGSQGFAKWRAALGAVDLVFIDGNHHHAAVRRDFETNRRHPHRFLVFHDIVGGNRHTAGVERFWSELDEGEKWTILRPHRELGLNHTTMGIGIWSAQKSSPS